ncbi:TRAP transporter small permease [Devosia sp. Root635]|uniref:TRAP transporter small permease n=1 Tax=Devosia sp. Root635 TaxID=1736575 RepID=UPI000701D392|nr:TRAP transporter small permease [Devosia sp. Root635]KRA43261.1 C4-dicarboxylate ABC transporter substrate-binding protein [Devosia sp. Root635]
MFQDSSFVGRIVVGIARWMAIAGGLALVGMIAIVIVSVVGRAFIWAGLKPILGDYELISIGMGFAIFAFLPWAHITRGHALVSLLTDTFPPAVNAWILVVTDLLMLIISVFIAWRLWLGMLDKFSYRETTILLGLSMGWAFAAAVVGAIAMVLVAIYVLGRSISDALAGRAGPKHVGSDH